MKSDPFAKTEEGSAKSLLIKDASREDIVVRALQECQAAIDAGQSIDREVMLAKYPEIRDELSACLEGLELMSPAGVDDKTLLSGAGHLRRASPLSPTATLGDFRIRGEIGKGGMGVVYEAEQLSVGRKVALKVLPYAAMLDKRQVARFQNEARAAATLEHPNIVPVYFVGNERGVYYYAMRLIDGKNLSEVLQELRGKAQSDSPLSQISSNLLDSDESNEQAVCDSQHTRAETVRDQAGNKSTSVATNGSLRGRVYFESIARLAKQVAEALDFAHSHGIIHRDIKPANIMLDEVGDAWVTDFGLARIEADAGMTMTGDLVGTLRYMSPEQTLAKRITVDHRSDVYSLGATIYELLTLQPIFDGADRATLLKKIAFDEPKSLSKNVKGVPADLETIVLKTLQKNPDDRYATAMEVAEDLERFLTHQPVQARRTPLPQRLSMWAKRHPAIVTSATIVSLVALVSAAAIGWLIASHERDARTQEQVATKEIADALETARSNLELANEERERAESNLSLAIQAVEETYLNSIGEDRLLRIGVRTEFTPPLEPKKLLTAPPLQSSGVRFSQIAQRPTFSDEERDVVRRGLKFYDQIASLNPTSPKTQFQSAKAFTRLALLYGGLDENAEAQAAYEEAISRFESLTDQSPKSAEYFTELARAYYQQARLNNWWPDAGGTFDEAITAATRAIQIDTENVEAYRLRGRAHLCLHQYEPASKDLQKVVEFESDSPAAHYELSQALEEASELEKAAIHLQKSVELDPTNDQYRNALASLYKFGLKDKESAGALFEPLLQAELSPRDEAEVRARQSFFKGPPRDVIKYVDRFNELGGESFETYYWRARSHRWQKKHELAEADLKDALKLAKTDEHFRDVAFQFYKLGDNEIAIDAWDRAEELNANNYQFFQDRGLAFIDIGEYQRASEDLRRFIELVPDKENHVHLYHNMGALDFTLGNYDSSLEFFESAFHLDPRDLNSFGYILSVYDPEIHDPPQFRDGFQALIKREVKHFSELIEAEPKVAAYLLNRATALSLSHHHEAAIEDYDQALRIDPDNGYALTLLGMAYKRNGQHAEAIEALARAIELQPKAHYTWFNRARTYEADGKFSLARSDYEELTSIDPGNISGWFGIAATHHGLGQWKQAIDAWTRVIELEPFQHYAWQNRGNAYVQLEQFHRAVDDEDHAIELRPDLPDGWRIRGYAHFMLGQQEKAVADFSKAAELGNFEQRLNHVRALWRLGRAVDAIPLLRRHLEDVKEKQEKAGSDLVVAESVIDAFRNLGYMQLAAGRNAAALNSFEDARQIAEKLTTSMPENWSSWALLGQAHEEIGWRLLGGDRERAYDAFRASKSATEKSLAVESNLMTLNNMAFHHVNCPIESMRDPQEALRLIRQTAKQAGADMPGELRVHLATFAGRAHYHLGEWQQALTEFESITEPWGLGHQYHIAMINWKLGNHELARKQLTEAIEADLSLRASKAPSYGYMAGWDLIRWEATDMIGLQKEFDLEVMIRPGEDD